MQNTIYYMLIISTSLLAFSASAMKKNTIPTEEKPSSLRPPTVAIFINGKISTVEANYTLLSNQYYVLHFIATQNDPENLIGALINKGAIVDIKDIHGLTPLFYAVQNRQHKNARVLLENKANANSTDALGFTPLDHTYFNDDIEMRTLLSQYQAQRGTHNLEAIKDQLAAVKKLDSHIQSQFCTLTKKTQQCKSYEEFQKARASLIDFCKQNNIPISESGGDGTTHARQQKT